MFQVVPSIPVSAGRFLPGATGVSPPRENPLAVAQFWIRAGVQTVHIEEFGSSLGPRLATAPALIWSCRNKGVRLQAGGGIADIESARVFLRAGAQNLVVRKALRDPRRMARITGEINSRDLVAACSLSGESRPPTELETAWALGIRQCLVDGDFSRAPLSSRLCGILARLADGGWTIWAAGGIRDVAVIEALKALGVSGVIIGRAFYDGSLTWDAIRSVVPYGLQNG